MLFGCSKSIDCTMRAGYVLYRALVMIVTGHIGAGSILNVRGPGHSTVRAQKFRPRPLINGNAFVTPMKKQP